MSVFIASRWPFEKQKIARYLRTGGTQIRNSYILEVTINIDAVLNEHSI